MWVVGVSCRAAGSRRPGDEGAACRSLSCCERGGRQQIRLLSDMALIVRCVSTTRGGPVCWWCGGVADSREHKFKRRDLDLAIGKGSWHGRIAAHRRPGEESFSYPNSSRSNSLKFQPVLCSNCNSERSQPIDRAYDRFADYVRAYGRELYRTQCLDWGEVFDHDWELGRDNVTRYWVKHIACRLAELGIPIEPAMVAFLDGAGPLTHLGLSMEIRESFAIAHCDSLARGEPLHAMWIGDLLGWADRRTGQFEFAEGHWGIDAIFLVYKYSPDPTASTNFSALVSQLPLVRATEIES
jgi:hypothetical protein